MPRPISATLSMSALDNNLQVVRRHAPHSKVWSVVKANAYGHGIARIWQSLQSTDGFALLDFNEAVLLREAGWQGPILLLEGFFNPGDLKEIDRYRLTTSVHSHWQLAALSTFEASKPVNIYLKINSGMNRLGFHPNEAADVWGQLRAMPQVGEITLMSHFATADSPEGVNWQVDNIEKGTQQIPGPRSLANSAATLWHPQTHHDWVRPGIILYGASPSGSVQDIANTGLKPVMQLRSEIIAVQGLVAGDRVGYSGRYRAEREHRVGVVACGYADGYPRHAPSGTPVRVGGVQTVTLGTVSMDMLAVDLTPCPDAQIGTGVELWGDNLPIDDVAASAGTLGYELLTALAPRVPVIVK
ncbi:catabolic alanine racemase DadX [Rouxiella badensis]|jgi:alanine racemase|uniref:catabolic alanine racemase DadX n=1 Tax=Rouxiella badensis TaxID=1646377 RepID=UPI00178896FE|nr:catabolic alanine racemase DadX [Rouxiella badensis]MCC3703626.1 catabolic alanine racemase DadX [Rouxiella badensis]MCC3720569.1 catabolic alanine racemase DadX [Rouxiella badensis]MCC3730408.1 catabolic alanine racemase DadX [Rouxiella badensis]MCC3734474.1 catabolic alanine racemase DadX [Rouxiella badensis]MCC3742756.1 catabolic alanine racemase DadX [Rouxiella badensis]